jgi:GMP synthase (glutamine-hydrolysing)
MRHIHRFPWGTGNDVQVWIIHFGSKSTPLIAQLCREIGLRSRVIPWQDLAEAWRKRSEDPRFLILSGGDQSVYDKDAPTLDHGLFRELAERCALLGICYGAQLLVTLAGGEVRRAQKAEFGDVRVMCDGFGAYRGGAAIMNHRDEITRLPYHWRAVASTERCANALVGANTVWAVQFHPEMDHTENGEAILRNVAFSVAGCRVDYGFIPHQFIAEARTWLRNGFSEARLFCGLSGGVDSSVAFSLARKAQQQRGVRGLYVDTGWMRENELEEIRDIFGNEDVTYVNAAERFHERIEAVPYPVTGSVPEREGAYYEAVRKAIGSCFIDVFAAEAEPLLRVDRENGTGTNEGLLLLQGTNASDIIESETGLKAHHNVGGLPDVLKADIIEPLAGLYKFEIRELASALELPREIVQRQPFPGPGLAIRAWGKLSREYAPPLRAANRILEEVMREYYADPRARPCQYYAALAPIPSTGLMGDARVIGYAWWVRMVTARRRESYSTLGVFEPSVAFLRELAHRLTTETSMPDGTPFVRVSYEITGKPPSTTEPH